MRAKQLRPSLACRPCPPSFRGRVVTNEIYTEFALFKTNQLAFRKFQLSFKRDKLLAVAEEERSVPSGAGTLGCRWKDPHEKGQRIFVDLDPSANSLSAHSGQSSSEPLTGVLATNLCSHDGGRQPSAWLPDSRARAGSAENRSRLRDLHAMTSRLHREEAHLEGSGALPCFSP